jgi:ubiquinone/menaquinone biosynthesis C-methylase UbiE
MYSDLFRKLRVARLIPTRTHCVLDCGTGSESLASSYGRISTGLASIHGTSPLTCDLAHLPFPSAHFDVVMGAHCQEHTRTPPATVAEMSRVLTPGGLLLFITRRSSDVCDVLGWMWESGVSPLGCMPLGRPRQIGHWFSQAVLGTKAED